MEKIVDTPDLTPEWIQQTLRLLVGIEIDAEEAARVLPREHIAEVLASERQPQGGLAAKYHVTLTEEERARLEALTQKGRVAARTVRHAWILFEGRCERPRP